MHFATHCFFKSAPHDDLQWLASVIKVRKYAKSAVIYHQYDEANAIYVIKTGITYYKRTYKTGGVFTLGVSYNNDVFGELEIHCNIRRRASCIALEDTELYVIDKHNFLILLQKPWFAAAYANHLGKKTLSMQLLYELMATSNTERRFLYWLLWFADKQLEESIEPICINFSQNQLAELTQVSRQLVNKYLKQFESYNWLVVAYNKIQLIEMEELKKYAARLVS